MTEKNKGGKLILIFGGLAIIIVTICAFNKENITHKYFEYTIDKKYSNITTNDYYLEDNFSYVDNYTDTGINSKEDLINLCKKISENNEVFIIGGASLYSMFIDIADVLYITHIEKVEETADVYFPKIDEAKWKKNILANDEDNNIKFSWVEYTKI